jgi:hypothetical protein
MQLPPTHTHTHTHVSAMWDERMKEWHVLNIRILVVIFMSEITEQFSIKFGIKWVNESSESNLVLVSVGPIE